MTGKPRTPRDPQGQEAPQPMQQMQDDGGATSGEFQSLQDDDEGQNFANINPGVSP